MKIEIDTDNGIDLTAKIEGKQAVMDFLKTLLVLSEGDFRPHLEDACFLFRQMINHPELGDASKSFLNPALSLLEGLQTGMSASVIIRRTRTLSGVTEEAANHMVSGLKAYRKHF